MPNYRRVKIEGGTYFLTLVTYKRQKLFSSPHTRELFFEALQHVKHYHPFILLAYCILPDHIHLLIELPEDDINYSMRIGEIKKRFSKIYFAKCGVPNKPQIRKDNQAQIWQNRFWEHYIRDEKDLSQHIDYIHYNPVNHRLVNQTIDWPSSSFAEYVREGYYDSDWGIGENMGEDNQNYGE